MLVHATAIAINGRAVLLTGPARSGKSDLALRAIADGAVLIADDLVDIVLSSGRLMASRPDHATPALALRGVGIIRTFAALDTAPLSLCVRLDPQLDHTALTAQLGQAGPWHEHYVPEIALHPFEASAAAKLALALERFGF